MGDDSTQSSVQEEGGAQEEVSFAPDDSQDGRLTGEWQTRYDKKAWRNITGEAAYLVVLLFVVPLILFALWSRAAAPYLDLSPERYDVFCRFVFVGLGGVVGGTLFGMKWLYHVVARGLWHEDRRLWRFLTPLISGTLAFSIGVLISSDIFGAFDPAALQTGSSAFAIGFLVGYFSDTALAKLSEVARSLFGVSERHTHKR